MFLAQPRGNVDDLVVETVVALGDLDVVDDLVLDLLERRDHPCLPLLLAPSRGRGGGAFEAQDRLVEVGPPAHHLFQRRRQLLWRCLRQIGHRSPPHGEPGRRHATPGAEPHRMTGREAVVTP